MVDIPINDLDPINKYTAAGGEPGFDYDFIIFDQNHLVVEETDPSDLNNPVTLVLGVDYTVTGVLNPAGGGIVLDTGVYPTGAIATHRYTVYREVPYERVNDYQFSGDFESSDVNTDFDFLVMQTQQLNRDLQASLRLKKSDSLSTLMLSVQDNVYRQGRALIFNATGDELEAGPNASDIANAQTYAAQAEISKDGAEDAEIGALAAQAAAEAAAAGMKWRPSVRAATTTTLPACTYANGTSGVGATLTGNANGALTAQDGVTLIVGNRLLVKNQAGALQNGVYIVTQVGTGGSPFILTRATDADTWSELVSQAVIVEEGSTNGDKVAICTIDNGGTIGTTSVTWTLIEVSIADGSIAYAKLAASAIGAGSDLISGTASKLVNAAEFKAANKILQFVQTTTTTATSTTSTIPFDNTVPQNTEGTEVVGLQTAITPKNASSLLMIELEIDIIGMSTNQSWGGAIFVDSVANAIAAGNVTPSGATFQQQFRLKVFVSAGSTSARTYKFRFGPNSGTAYFLQGSAGALYGGTAQATMTITEILP
jgi:hypothetical protein